jgi:nitric oxide reductase NorD protein
VSTGDRAIDALVEQFHINIAANERETMFSWGLGVELYNMLSERRCIPSLRILESLNIPYRDDNRFVWSMDDYDWSESNAYRPELQRQVRRNVGLMEFINEVDVETAGDDAQEVWVLSSELFPYEDEGVSYNEMEGKEPVSDPFHYAEWDYKVQLHRPSWATVYERRQGKGDPDSIDTVLTAHKGVSHRIRQIVDRLRPQGFHARGGWRTATSSTSMRPSTPSS